MPERTSIGDWLKNFFGVKRDPEDSLPPTGSSTESGDNGGIGASGGPDPTIGCGEGGSNQGIGCGDCGSDTGSGCGEGGPSDGGGACTSGSFS